MRAVKNFFNNLHTRNLSVTALREQGLQYWRERVYSYTISALIVLGFFALVPSVFLSLASRFYFLAVFDILAYAYILVLFFLKGLSYRARVSQILLLGLAVGLVVFYITGDEGAGLFWLFMVPPLASLLLGLRAGSAFLLLNVAIAIATGYLVHVESHLLPGLLEFSLSSWAVYALNFLVTDALITIPLGVLLEGLFSGAQREQTLRADYQLLFENNPLPMWVYDAESFRFLAVNQAAVDHYGYSREEFLSMTIKEIRPSEELDKLASSLSNRTARQSSGPWKHRKKDGSIILVEIYSHELDFGGRLARLVLANDVTEEIRADEQLQQSDRILSRVQSLVLVIDEEGLIIYASPAAEDILGYTPAQLLGEGWWQLTRVDPEEARREKETLRKIISGEIDLPTEPYERQIRTAYGDLRWIEWTDSYGPGKMLIGVGHDVTERKADSEKIRKQVNQLRALSEVNRAILSSFDLRQNIKTLVDRVIPQLQVDAANVMVLNPTFMKLKSIYGRGFKLESLEGEEVRLGDGNAGKAALTQKIVHVPRLHEQRDNPLLLQAISGEKFVSYYGVPLIARGKTQGVLEVFQRRDFQADEGWLEMLSAFASQAAIAIETITAFEEMQRSNSELVVAYNATIEGWSRAMDLRDKETEGARRVTELAEKLAERMGLRGRELSNLRRGALLHDIGMMGIPDGILLKPGKLSEAEREIVRQHPLHALNMLEPIQYLREALDIPYSHHEKWDGSGYPRGLKGEEIPLAARIFAVVDVYDALTNDRPYRKAWTQEKALEYIRKEAGKHFDPQVVTEFLAIV